MPRLVILLAGNGLDSLYHVLALALSARALNWDVKVFVASQAAALLLRSSRQRRGLGLSVPLLAKLYLRFQMRRLRITRVESMLEEALREGVEFHVDEVTLKLLGASREDLRDGVRLSGSVTFLTEARDSDVVLAL